MESGWDPDIKRFLLKVLNSISLVLLWLIAGATAGIYFKLGYANGKQIIYTVIFYTAMAVTFFLLLRHLYRMWNKR